jgi:hypothetical protein
MELSVLNFLDGAVEILEKFKDGKPLCIGKIGNAELMCAYNYYYAKHHNQSPIPWNSTVVKEIYINAGVFPQTEESRIYFSEQLSDAVANADVMAPWNRGLGDFELRFIRSRNTNCTLVDLQSLEPFYSGIPWSSTLKDKNVLVISPFTETIKNQYKNRESIWSNPNVLPKFNLKTIYHPTSKAISGDKNKYSTWKEMIDDIRHQMFNTEFDVALIGTGASSLPLTSFAKQINRQAIHLGGSLQLMFGIKGKRWEQMKIFNHFYNDSWTRPSADETPEGYKLVEDGTYW